MPTSVRSMRRTVPKLSAAPVLDRIPKSAQRGIVRRAVEDVDESSRINDAISRSRDTGWLTLWAADRVAIRVLGEHPATLWGDEYWTCDGPADEYLDEVEAELAVPA